MTSSSCLVPTSWHPTGVTDCPEGPFGGSGRPVTHLLLHFASPQGKYRKVAQQRIWGDNPVPTKCIWSYSSVRTIAGGTQCVPGVSSTCQIPTFYLWDTDVTLYMWNMKGRSWGLFPELSVFNMTCLPLGAAGLLPASAQGGCQESPRAAGRSPPRAAVWHRYSHSSGLYRAWGDVQVFALWLFVCFAHC